MAATVRVLPQRLDEKGIQQDVRGRSGAQYMCWACEKECAHPDACACRVNREGGPRMVRVKQVFAIQSDYAVGKAADAAEAKVEECEPDRAFAKVCRNMQLSQSVLPNQI